MIEDEVLDKYQITKSTLQSIICRKRMIPMVDYFTLDTNKYGFTPKGVDILIEHFESDRTLNEWLRRMALNLVDVDGICERTALSQEVVRQFIRDKFVGTRYSYVLKYYDIIQVKSLTKPSNKELVKTAKNDVKTALNNILGDGFESIQYYG